MNKVRCNFHIMEKHCRKDVLICSNCGRTREEIMQLIEERKSDIPTEENK